MATYTTTFANLDALLQSLSNNNVNTPYDIEITEGLTYAVCTSTNSSSTSGTPTLQKVLKKNSNKYVDLRPTIIKQDTEYSKTNPCYMNFDNFLYGCSTVIYGPTIKPKSVSVLRSAGNTKDNYYMPYNDTMYTSCQNIKELYFPDSILLGSPFSTDYNTATSSKELTIHANCVGNIDRLVDYVTNKNITLKIYCNRMFDSLYNEYTAKGIEIIRYEHEINNISQLDALLTNLPDNDVNNPYIITMPINDFADDFNAFESSNTQGSIGYILKQHTTKYVDLSENIMRAHYAVDVFKGCTTLIKAPTIRFAYGCKDPTDYANNPSKYTNTLTTEINYTGLFEGCTNLKAVDIFMRGDIVINNEVFCPSYTYNWFVFNRTFYGCASLETVGGLDSYLLSEGWQNTDMWTNCISLKHLYFYYATSTELSTIRTNFAQTATSLPSEVYDPVTGELKDDFIIITGAYRPTKAEINNSPNRYAITNCRYSMSINNLDTILQSFNYNDTNHPYEIKFTDTFTNTLIGNMNTYLRNNPYKFVSLGANDVSWSSSTSTKFMCNCFNVIYPCNYIGSSGLSRNENYYSNCTNLKATGDCVLLANSSGYSIFYGCVNLRTVDTVVFKSPKNEITYSLFSGDNDIRKLENPVVYDFSSLSVLQAVLPVIFYYTETYDFSKVAFVTNNININFTLGFNYYHTIKNIIIPDEFTLRYDSTNRTVEPAPIPMPFKTNIKQINLYSCTLLSDLSQFKSCENLTTIRFEYTGITTFSKNMLSDSVTTISGFYGCDKLIRADLRGYTSLNLGVSNQVNTNTDMYGMFKGCTLLEEVDLSDATKISSMNRAFYHCKNLTTILYNENVATPSYYNISGATYNMDYAYADTNSNYTRFFPKLDANIDFIFATDTNPFPNPTGLDFKVADQLEFMHIIGISPAVYDFGNIKDICTSFTSGNGSKNLRSFKTKAHIFSKDSTGGDALWRVTCSVDVTNYADRPLKFLGLPYVKAIAPYKHGSYYPLIGRISKSSTSIGKLRYLITPNLEKIVGTNIKANGPDICCASGSTESSVKNYNNNLTIIGYNIKHTGTINSGWKNFNGIKKIVVNTQEIKNSLISVNNFPEKDIRTLKTFRRNIKRMSVNGKRAEFILMNNELLQYDDIPNIFDSIKEPLYTSTPENRSGVHIGDLVLENGNTITFDNYYTHKYYETLPAVVGMVSHMHNNKWYIISTSVSNSKAWCTSSAQGYNITDASLFSKSDGYYNTYDVIHNDSSLDIITDYSSSKYPAFGAAIDWHANLSDTSNFYYTGWYIPAVDELQKAFNQENVTPQDYSIYTTQRINITSAIKHWKNILRYKINNIGNTTTGAYYTLQDLYGCSNLNDTYSPSGTNALVDYVPVQTKSDYNTMLNKSSSSYYLFMHKLDEDDLQSESSR